MLVWDIEADNLLDKITKLHCINVLDRQTGKRLRFNKGVYDDTGLPAPRDGTLEDGLALIASADCIGGHNIIGYDIPALQKLYPGWKPRGRVRDSLVECRVIWTNIFDIDMNRMRKGLLPDWFKSEGLLGAHSLRAWGVRFGNRKKDYDGGFEFFTNEMDVYCQQDVEANTTIFERIDAKDYSNECIELENTVAQIVFMQEQHGFLFDNEAAERLLRVLEVRHAHLTDELRTAFRPWYAPKRKAGKVEVFTPKVGNKTRGVTKGHPFTKAELVVFNPASRQHIADRLATLFGWKPAEFTERGQPKIDETTLDGMNYPEAKLLMEYLTVEKRLGQLATGKQAWMKAVKADGRIHGRVNTNGAVTGRMTHSTPNMAQVPASHSPYGMECRSLFTTASGFALVGCDAEGLELRMLGHYMARFDNGAYADTVVNGKKEDGTDVHTVNQKVVGLNSRDSAKTFIYAYLYGAGAYKLGTIILDDMSDARRAAFNAKYPAGDLRDKALARLGKKAKQRIEDGLPALGKLQELVKKKAARGFLKGLDGRLLHVRSTHAALNTLLQGAGAIVMKQALVIAYRECSRRGWVHGREYGFTANVHDEFQAEVREDLAESFGALCADAIRLAGEHFGLLCPLSGAFGVGKNWAQTH